MILVVDASALGAVLFTEHDATWIEAQTNGADLIAPAILPFELGNICWKKIRRAPEEADRLLVVWGTWVISAPVTLEQTNHIETLQLAREHGLTFYDASYLWLAQERAVDLISLDGPLVRAARAIGLHAPSPPR